MRFVHPQPNAAANPRKEEMVCSLNDFTQIQHKEVIVIVYLL